MTQNPYTEVIDKSKPRKQQTLTLSSDRIYLSQSNFKVPAEESLESSRGNDYEPQTYRLSKNYMSSKWLEPE